MSSEVHAGLHSWRFPIATTLVVVGVTLAYLWSWYRLRTAVPDPLRRRRLAAFMSGAFTLWAAAGSPLSALDHQFLTAHMIQHLLLMTAAAPLILLGAPVFTLRHGLPAWFIDRVLTPLSRSPLPRGLRRTVAHPVFCWFASTAVVMSWHVPALFELGMRSEKLHGVEQLTFFAAGLLFWWPVIQPWPSASTCPRWAIPFYLFLATLPCDALSAFLTFCDRVVYPHYLGSPRTFPLSALGDQECAGALMWVSVTFAYLIPAAVVTIRILSPIATDSAASFRHPTTRTVGGANSFT
jgi:cytochrome c oxidase assembly factor CtaG